MPTKRGGNFGNGYTAKKVRTESSGIGELAPAVVSQNQNQNQNREEGDVQSVDVEDLAEAPVRNPSDALEILARTSPANIDDSYDENSNSISTGEASTPDGHDLPNNIAERASRSSLKNAKNSMNYHYNGSVDRSEGGGESGTSAGIENRTGTDLSSNDAESLQQINDFLLVRLGIINITQLRTFVSVFISRHHLYFPIIPEYRLPTNDHLLGKFCVEETFLLMVIVLIASRFDKSPVHESCWRFTRCHLSGITYGGLPSVGVVEALLLLSENLPRLSLANDNNFHYVESFMCWNLVGLAVRFSYFLGLDQKTLLSPYEVPDEQTARERLAWTYCYIYDRQISIRLGKAFWSRGPGLCFESLPETGMEFSAEAHMNFPPLASVPKSQALNSENSLTARLNGRDHSLLVQAHVELTQILTNIHDSLYPSKDRTIILVRKGQYYRMLDEFTRTFSSFWLAWRNNFHWTSAQFKQTIWATFHYAKLYAYSFAFQAHIQRATSQNKQRLDNAGSRESLADLIFPRGLMGCPDSKFILESVDSASKLLKICLEDLSAAGALAYLPSRFYGYFSYAAVFLIKVVLTGAVATDEKTDILSLVRKFIRALQSTSSGVDKQHFGVRSARQLQTLLKSLVAATGTTLAPTPSRSSPATTSGQPTQDIFHNQEDDYAWFDDFDYGPLDIQGMNRNSGNTISVTDGLDLPDICTQQLEALLSTDIDGDFLIRVTR